MERKVISGLTGWRKGRLPAVPAAILPRCGRRQSRPRHIWCFGIIINQIELETVRRVDSPRRIAVTRLASESPIERKALPRSGHACARGLAPGPGAGPWRRRCSRSRRWRKKFHCPRPGRSRAASCRKPWPPPRRRCRQARGARCGQRCCADSCAGDPARHPPARRTAAAAKRKPTRPGGDGRDGVDSPGRYRVRWKTSSNCCATTSRRTRPRSGRRSPIRSPASSPNG